MRCARHVILSHTVWPWYYMPSIDEHFEWWVHAIRHYLSHIGDIVSEFLPPNHWYGARQDPVRPVLSRYFSCGHANPEFPQSSSVFPSYYLLVPL
jgi:hypothetical protein